MVSSREPKLGLLEDIQKTHGLSIPRGFHILYNKYPLVFPSLVNSSSLLYTLPLIAIGNAFTLVDTVFSSRKPSEHQLSGQSIRVVFPYLDRSVLPDILILLYIFHFL